MNQQNDPPILMSDEWQHQNERGQPQHLKPTSHIRRTTGAIGRCVDDSEESAPASEEPTIPPSTLPAQRDGNCGAADAFGPSLLV